MIFLHHPTLYNTLCRLPSDEKREREWGKEFSSYPDGWVTNVYPGQVTQGQSSAAWVNTRATFWYFLKGGIQEKKYFSLCCLKRPFLKSYPFSKLFSFRSLWIQSRKRFSVIIDNLCQSRKLNMKPFVAVFNGVLDLACIVYNLLY